MFDTRNLLHNNRIYDSHTHSITYVNKRGHIGTGYFFFFDFSIDSLVLETPLPPSALFDTIDKNPGLENGFVKLPNAFQDR